MAINEDEVKQALTKGQIPAGVAINFGNAQPLFAAEEPGTAHPASPAAPPAPAEQPTPAVHTESAPVAPEVPAEEQI